MDRFRTFIVYLAIAGLTSIVSADQPEELAETLEKLLPDMASEKNADRKQAQYRWEQICRSLCAPGKEDLRKQACQLMAANLGERSTSQARICLLRQLEYLGNEECVDAVALAMDDTDPLVRSAALRALASNPSAEATRKLVDGLESSEDTEFKVGLLNALGYRGDPSSTNAIADILDDPDKAIVASAARALGKIATPPAAAALKARRKASEGELRQQLCNASLRCANKMMDENFNAAHKIYLDLVAEDMALPMDDTSVRDAALHGMLSIAGPAELEFHLSDKIPGNARVAAAHIADLDKSGIKKLIGNLAKLPAASQVLVLQALAVRADKSVMPEVVAAAGNQDQVIRIAALRALSSLGDVSVVPLLLGALSENGELASAARDSLEAIYGDGVDSAIIVAMQEAEQIQPRALLIEILQRRQSNEAVPALLKEARHDSSEIRSRAMSALSEVAELQDVPAMVQGVLASTAGSERDQAEKAVMLLCNRLDDEDHRADQVLKVFESASLSDRKALLPLLGRIGGPGALQQIEAAIGSQQDLHDAGIRAICNWPNGDVAESLLEISQTSKKEQHRLAAMRAFIRVIALKHARPNSESLGLLRKAMDLCTRDEERNLILSRTISSEIRSLEALQFVLPYLDNSSTAQEACRAVVGLSHHRYLRRPNQAEFNKALGKVIETSTDPALVDQARRYRSDL